MILSFARRGTCPATHTLLQIDDHTVALAFGCFTNGMSLLGHNRHACHYAGSGAICHEAPSGVTLALGTVPFNMALLFFHFCYLITNPSFVHSS
jgi:hypothetical protein